MQIEIAIHTHLCKLSTIFMMQLSNFLHFFSYVFLYDFGSGWSSSEAELSFVCSRDWVWWVWVMPCPAGKHGIMSSMSIVAMSVSMSMSMVPM